MPIENESPVVQPEVIYDKLWLFSTSIQTTKLGQPDQSSKIVQIWRAYRLLPDGRYDFHPTWREAKVVEDVYGLAATDPVVAAGIQGFIETSLHIKDL